MSMNSIEMSANNDAVDDDDNEDDFLPPGFVPGAAPRIVVDLHSPSPHHPRTRRTSVSTDASRNEYLHRSISALKHDHDHDHDHEEFVDLLGLESIPKENIPRSVNMDSFWLLPTSDTDTVPHETVFSVSKPSHDAMDISYLPNSPNDYGINSKLDELAADLEAEVEAGHLFLAAINTPLLTKPSSTTAPHSHKRTSLDILPTGRSKQYVDRLKRDLAQLHEEVQEARHEAMVQRERATQLETELQQLALSTAAEQHNLQGQCHQYEKEVENMVSQMKLAVYQVQESNAVIANVTQERDALRDHLVDANHQIATLQNENEAVKSQCSTMEAKLTDDLHSLQERLHHYTEECRVLNTQLDVALRDHASLKSDYRDTKHELDQSVKNFNDMKVEVLRLNELVRLKDDVIATHVNKDDPTVQFTNDMRDAKRQVEELISERDVIQNLFDQISTEQSELHDRFLESQTTLQEQVHQNEVLQADREALREQLRQAEDLALLVDADNDRMQQRLLILQNECESLRHDTVAMATSMMEKDQKIRSLQRFVGAMQSLLLDESSLTDDNNGAVRSLQRRIGALKDQYEQQTNDVQNRADETIQNLQQQNQWLEQTIQERSLEWTTALEKQAAETSQDMAKIRNLKRRIGATEALLDDTVNEATEQQNGHEAVIRSLQRRIGGLADELNALKEKHSEQLDQLVLNEQLHQKLTTTERSITTLQNDIRVLEEDLQDAYEREDQIQEDFVQAMMYATAEIEKLHATYTTVFHHLKEQYHLVEDELFDALEREDDLIEAQAQLNSDHKMAMDNLQASVNDRLQEAAGCSEGLRQQCLMNAVDMYQDCRRYFGNIHAQSMVSVDHEYVWLLEAVNEKHIADMVQLFRDVSKSLPSWDLKNSEIEASSDTETTESSPAATAKKIHDDDDSLGMKVDTATKSMVGIQSPRSHGGETATKSVVSIQSPRSAFESYTNNKICDASKSNGPMVDEASNNTASVPEITTEPTTSGEDRVPTIGIIVESPLQPVHKAESSIRKSLHFATPSKIAQLNSQTKVTDPKLHQSTPKISAAKAKLRLIESSRLAPPRDVKRHDVKLESNKLTTAKATTVHRKTTTNSGIPAASSKLNQRAQRSGQMVAQPSSSSSMKRTVKPKLDTGLVKLTGVAKVRANPCRPVTSSVTGLPVIKPTVASSSRIAAAASVKPKSRLPQFGSSRIASTSSIATQNKSRVSSTTIAGKAATNTDLFRKLSDLTATSSTPLTARSTRSDKILAKSVSATKIPAPNAGLQLFTPQPRVEQLAAHFKEYHFTPIHYCDEDHDSTSPISPLVTPKGESIARNQFDSKTGRVEAATKIQALQRGALVRQVYKIGMMKNEKAQRMKQRESSAIVLQRYVRSRKQFLLARSLLVKKLQHIVQIQHVWRGALARKKVIRIRQNDAAVTLQKLGRVVLARRSFLKMKYASKILQFRYRDYLIKKRITSETNCRMVKATILLQRNYRRYSCQAHLSASIRSVIRIQGWVRGIIGRSIANDRRSTSKRVTLIQAIVRRRIALRNFATTKAVIVQIQHQVRRLIVKRKSVSQIQREWRRFVAHRKYKSVVVSVITVQSVFRRHRASRLATTARKRITLIQSIVRQRIALRNFARTKALILQIQQRVRRMIVKQKSVSQIQCEWRRFVAHRQYKSVVDNVITIQSVFRRHRACRLATSKRQQNSALRIQTFFRMTTIHSQYSSLLYASLQIQAQVRKLFARQRLVALKKGITAIIALQARWRRITCRGEFMTIVLSTSTIQRYVRGFVHRRKARMISILMSAAIVIQRAWKLRRDRVSLVEKQKAEQSFRQAKEPFREQPTPQIASNNRKRGNRVVLGHLNSSMLQVSTNSSSATSRSRLTTSDIMHKLGENQSSNDENRAAENIRPERNSDHKAMRTVLAVESFSTAVKRVKETSFSHGGGAVDQTCLLDEIEKMKVVELRHELKSFGMESKNYNKLRKVELVTLVFEQRKARPLATN